MSWEGERPEQFEYIQVPTSAHTNHGRNKEYSDWVSQELQRNPADVIVGFNKMPGLDYYYAADVCYAEKVEQEKGFYIALRRVTNIMQSLSVRYFPMIVALNC